FAERAGSKSDSTPTEPGFSDFVLSYEDGMLQGANAPALTFSYNLPPGQENAWRNWVLKELHGEITHVQFSQKSSGDFSPGQWLELVDTRGNPVCTIAVLKSAAPDKFAIPAIDRRFPSEPVLNEVGIMPVNHLVPTDAASLQTWDPSVLSKWDWSVL